MAKHVSSMSWNAAHQDSQPIISHFAFEITAAVTVKQKPFGQPCLVTFGAISSQSTIDNFLGNTNDFLIADFDATAMGADAMGLIVNLDGQAKEACYMVARCYSGTAGATLVERMAIGASSATDSTLDTSYWISSAGNLAARVNWGNTPDFDGLTAGLIIFELAWLPK